MMSPWAAPTCSAIQPIVTLPCFCASTIAEVVAFSQKCTHLGCVVYYQAEEERWHCPCHEGNFDSRTGSVLSGPPTRPLGRIDVEIRDDGQIWAVGRSE